MTSVTTTPESWRLIPGYGGKYEASSIGRIRNVATGLIRATTQSRAGYKRLNLYHERDHTVGVHVLVAAAFHGPRPTGMDTRHMDGNKSNNNEANLQYGTRSENQLDRRRHGTAYNAHTDQTHCKRGHEFTPDNTWQHHEGGKRACKTCQSLRVTWKRDGLWDYEAKAMIKPAITETAA